MKSRFTIRPLPVLRPAHVAFFLMLSMLALGQSSSALAQGALQFTVLHAFSALSTSTPATNSDGATPSALVSDAQGNVYGETSDGGANGTGTIFKVTAGTLTILHTFSAVPASYPHTNDDGAAPNGGLVKGSDGNFYGTTSLGGTAGTGTVFKITPAGVLTTLYFFGLDVFSPNALVLGSDGNFYGTVEGGGSNTGGFVFEVTPTGTVTILHNFGDGSVANDGVYPYDPLILGPDGNFYGTTEGGGANNTGVVFKVTQGGTLTVMHSFAATVPFGDADGSYPYAPLVVGPDGNLYGTTISGGGNNSGTVFKITPSGAYATLYSFSTLSSSYTNRDGSIPNALIVGPSGDLYGTAKFGGTGGNGTVFRLTTGGILTTLVNFYGLDGVSPTTSLTVGQGDVFYGTTSEGGANGTGTIFYLDDDPQNDLSWFAAAIGAGTRGTGTVLWTRNDGAAGIWALGANDAETAIGATYGPFFEWSAQAVATAADGTSRVLWTKTTGEAGIWNFDAHGHETAAGPTYGPYFGWTAQDIGVAGDGTSRVLWTNVYGAAGVWSFSASGTATRVGPAYGPVDGWTAASLATVPDGTSRVLWNNTSGQMGLWSFDANDINTEIGPTYGPFAGWTATAVGAAGDGTSRVLWTNTDDEAGLWSFDADDAAATRGAVYGPYFQIYGANTIWTATSLSTAADGTSRVLWNDTYSMEGPNGTTGVWTFGANDTESVIGPVL